MFLTTSSIPPQHHPQHSTEISPASCYCLRMLSLRRCVVGVVAVLLVGGLASAQTQTPTSLETGTIVINPQFDDASSFSDGLAAVSISGRYGFIAR